MSNVHPLDNLDKNDYNDIWPLTSVETRSILISFMLPKMMLDQKIDLVELSLLRRCGCQTTSLPAQPLFDHHCMVIMIMIITSNCSRRQIVDLSSHLYHYHHHQYHQHKHNHHIFHQDDSHQARIAAMAATWTPSTVQGWPTWPAQWMWSAWLSWCRWLWCWWWYLWKPWTWSCHHESDHQKRFLSLPPWGQQTWRKVHRGGPTDLRKKYLRYFCLNPFKYLCTPLWIIFEVVKCHIL